MPRGPRVDFPGAFHHVYARGIEKRDIFADDRDRTEFRRRISSNLGRFAGTCLAWSFMPNHFHLLYHSGGGNLPGFMRCLMSGYSTAFNRRHRRVGHLFQNRYKSAVIDNEPYLLQLIRYIHLNPLRSRIVGSMEELAAYRWTGHHDIVRTGKSPWQKFPYLEGFFSGLNGKFEVERYLDFLGEGTKIGLSAWNSACDEPNGTTLDPDDPEQADPFLLDDVHRTIRKVALRLCINHGILIRHLRLGKRSRAIANVRKDVLKVCVIDLGIPRRKVSRWLGISDAGAAFLLKGICAGTGSSGELGRSIQCPRTEKLNNVPGL